MRGFSVGTTNMRDSNKSLTTFCELSHEKTEITTASV